MSICMMLIKCLLQITCRVSSAARLNSLVTLYRLWKNLFPLFNNSYKNCDLMLQQKFDWVEGFQAPLWVKKPRWVHENQIEVEVSRFWETELLKKIEFWTWQELEWPVLGSSCVCAWGLRAVKRSVSGLSVQHQRNEQSFFCTLTRGNISCYGPRWCRAFSIRHSLSQYRKWTKIKHCWGDKGHKNHVSLPLSCTQVILGVISRKTWITLTFLFPIYFSCLREYCICLVYSFLLLFCRFMCNFPLPVFIFF